MNVVNPQNLLCNQKLPNFISDDMREVYQFFRYRSTVGQKVAWTMIAATCLHLAFLTPTIAPIPHERAKVFSGILCVLALAACFICAPRPKRIGTMVEFAVSALLTLLLVLSSVLSLAPLPSCARAFVILSSGLGGFWCARIIMADETGQRIFRLLCTFALTAIILTSLICFFEFGNVYQCLDWNPHPLTSRMLLLWFAPLSYIIPWHPGSMWVIGLAVSTYAVFYLSGLKSVCLIPVGLLFMATLLGKVSVKLLLAILLPLAVALSFFFVQLPKYDKGLEFEWACYRVESLFFSFHIAARHPLLGVGLTAPKDSFVHDYHVRYPYSTKERFSESVRGLCTLENVFLSFVAETGIPFTLMYIAALTALIGRLVIQLGRPAGQTIFHPLVLLMPIVAGLLHFQVFDGLYHPQVSWLFHILLGLIPTGRRAPGITRESRP